MSAPSGFVYLPDFVSPTEEAELIAWIGGLPPASWEHPALMGRPARRDMACFGRHYRTSGRRLDHAPPIPSALAALRDRCQAAAGEASAPFAQTIVTRYPTGAGIGAHTDAPAFGPIIAGVSLGSACEMHFARGAVKTRWVLEPRSLYLLTGESRSAWTHQIARCPSLRYSITLRSLL